MPKKNEPTKLMRTYAIADLAAPALEAAKTETEPEVQLSNDEYEQRNQPQNQSHAGDSTDHSNNEPAPKKRQKTTKVPIREAIHANCKEKEPPKAEKKVSLIVINW